MTSSRKSHITDSDEWNDSTSEHLFSTSPSTSEEKSAGDGTHSEEPTSDDDDSCEESSGADEMPSPTPAPRSNNTDIRTSPIRKIKYHKQRWKTIYTGLCRYDVVRRISKELGLREVDEEEPWIINWMDCSVPYGKVMDLKRYQKINHFPGMNEVCRKDLLTRNLNRMRKLFPKEYNIFPMSWCIPADFSDLILFAGRKQKTLICKPDTGCQGRGIFLIRSLKDINPTERMVVQQYIPKPFLIDGFKFDMRLYVLVTAVDPDFRIYIYKEGLARFATVKYEKPDGENVDNMFMHLTNYAVNKHSDNFVRDDVAGSKRKLSAVEKWWRQNDYDVDEIWQRIDDVIIKTFISASATLKHNYRTCFPNHAGVNACFEVLGFDVLLDHKLKPWLLEVNLSPSFHIDSLLDKEVKEGLIRNTLMLLDLANCNPKRCEEEDRRKARLRLLANRKKSSNSPGCKDHSEMKSIQNELNRDSALSLEIFELEHMGDFRLIYPVHSHTEKYKKYFHYNSSLYQDTVASKAREECAKTLREDIFKKTRYHAEALAANRRDAKKQGNAERNRKHSRQKYRKVQLMPVSSFLPPPPPPFPAQLEHMWTAVQRDGAANLISGVPTYTEQHLRIAKDDKRLRAAMTSDEDSEPEGISSFNPGKYESTSENLQRALTCVRVKASEADSPSRTRSQRSPFWRDRRNRRNSSPVSVRHTHDVSNPYASGSKAKMLDPAAVKRYQARDLLSMKSNNLSLEALPFNVTGSTARLNGLTQLSAHVRMTRAHLARIESNFAKLHSIECRESPR